MKKTFAIAALVFSTGAFAAQTNTGCQGNCPTGDSITNQGGVGYGGNGGNATAGAVGVAIAGGGAGGSGGAGGAGGAGGSVVGSGNSSATGGAVVGSGNSTQGQQQGQNQGQSQIAKGGNANQGQSQSSRNDNRSSASNQNSNANSGNNAQTSVSVQGDTVTYQAPKIPVATAYAAGLTASNGTCMGSSSIGGQGMSLGLSFGTTWKDTGCDRRYNAQALAAVGQAKAAVALLCQDADIAAAMEVAGTPCAKAEAKVVSVSAEQELIAAAVARGETPDAIARARVGLPPLK